MQGTLRGLRRDKGTYDGQAAARGTRTRAAGGALDRSYARGNQRRTRLIARSVIIEYYYAS